MDKTVLISPIKPRIYIEFLRLELLEKGTELGLNNEITLHLSHELDYFIYQYQLLIQDR
ncbi:aspartyl-phosphate phosphatase Spo0E family protein [Halalkalibacter kiskunsagensis]|uniref:Aspartyl-phosphate phosphatase Spo0E family protein n=1 Tax=Halalkalibacter kiskunsagensis TaxID=1548599 RepID=A0ABV6KBS9_9BACI